MLFHIIYTDEHFKSDWHLIIDAENEKKAQEKVQHYLKSKHAECSSIQFFRQPKFNKIYAHFSFFKIFFQNGTGEKYCQILAKNREMAEKIFNERFPFKNILYIVDKKITICITEKKQLQRIKFQGIIAQPFIVA